MKKIAQDSGQNTAEQANPAAESQAEAAQVSAHDVLATDEHAGKGGSYIFDPKMGLRTAA